MNSLLQTGIAIIEDLRAAIDDLPSHPGRRPGGFAIDLARKAIQDLRDLTTRVQNSDDEVIYFRHLWPKIYGKFFFHIRICQLDLRLDTLPAPGQAALVESELRETARWFRSHAEFCLYYQSGSPSIDHMFTRAYSQGRLFEELALVIDAQYATLASYRAACCEALTAYKAYLEDFGNRLLRTQTGIAGRHYKFVPGKTAALELLVGLVETGAVEVDGKPASLTELSAAWETLFQQDLRDKSVLLNQMDNRKKESTPFIDSLAAGVLTRKSRLGK